MNGTDGFYTVLNIPVILKDLGTRGNSPLCTQNSVITDILQRIPIPRPLGKVNGQAVGHFLGTFADQQSSSNKPLAAPVASQGVLSTSINGMKNPASTARMNVMSPGALIPIFTTISTTATIQTEMQPTQTVLDESKFGGPGGDLTNVQNNNAFKLFQQIKMERSQSQGTVNERDVKGIMLITGFILYLIL